MIFAKLVTILCLNANSNTAVHKGYQESVVTNNHQNGTNCCNCGTSLLQWFKNLCVVTKHTILFSWHQCMAVNVSVYMAVIVPTFFIKYYLPTLSNKYLFQIHSLATDTSCFIITKWISSTDKHKNQFIFSGAYMNKLMKLMNRSWFE